MNTKKIFITWLPLAVAITLLSALILITVQQSYRMSANDPQIQYAQDVARNFKDTKDAESFVPTEKTDLAASLATFGIVYNNDGGLLASSAVLDNQTPAVPKGVFDTAKKRGTYAFTWQPKNGVRLAAVITKGEAGYVLIGRSLKEIEKRENTLYMIVLGGWLITMFGTLGTLMATPYLSSKKTSKKTKKQV